MSGMYQGDLFFSLLLGNMIFHCFCPHKCSKRRWE